MMSFHRSSSAFELIGGQLCADCRNKSGAYRSSSLNLDTFIGNKNGVFEWGGVNFTKSARDIYYVNDGNKFVLHATLKKQNGAWKEAEIDLSDRVTNHDGKLAYVPKAQDELSDLIDTDPLAATFSNIRDFATDLTQSLFGLPSPTHDRTPTYPSSAESNQTSHPYSKEVPREPTATADDDDILRSIPTSFDDPKTPVPEPAAEKEETPHKPVPSTEEAASTASLTSLSAAQQEEFQYELIMRTIKQFLLQGPGATVESKVTKDGQRELVFARGEEKFTLLASKIRPEILFDQEEYGNRRGSFSAESEATVGRCLTPETVEGEDDMVLI